MNSEIFPDSVFSPEIPTLFQAHVEHLERSAISVDVILERGYTTVLGKKQLQELGFSSQCSPPGILIPIFDVKGRQAGYQFRPDSPRADKKGKAVKYEYPLSATNRLDCPPRCQPKLADPSAPLWITEGVKKGDALASQGEVVVDLGGVFNWRGKNALGGKTALPDFEDIALNERTVYLCFDSDVDTNKNVRAATKRLAGWLRQYGADVFVVHLPQQDDQKIGVDDFLTAGHSIADVKALATPLEEEEEKETKEIFAAYFYHQGERRLYVEVRKTDGNYCFAYLESDGSVRLVPELIIGQQTVKPRYLPVKEGRIAEIVKMPDEGIASCALLSPAALYQKILSHLRTYLDLPELDFKISSYYILFTWFYPKVVVVGYLRFLADTGKGKSRALTVISDLCFYPVCVSGSSSFSGLFRTQDKWRGTLVMDESDLEAGKKGTVSKYLNLGFERGKYFILSDKEDPKRQEVFDPFSPKVMAMREPFDDNATEGRLLSISPHETTNLGIPIILPPEYYMQTQQLRNEIALFALHHWNKIDGNRMLSFTNMKLEPRLKQLAMPLSIVFQVWPEGEENFKQYLIARQQEVKRIRSLSWEGSLFNMVYSIAVSDQEIKEEFAEYYEPHTSVIQAVTPRMIAKAMSSTTKTVTHSLVSIGFKVELRRITIYTKDSEEKAKQKVVRAYAVPDERAWKEMASRYYYSEEGNLKDVDIPEVLKSNHYVCQEALQALQVLQDSREDKESVTDVTLVTGGDTPEISKPIKPCPACGSKDWWQREDGGWVCGRCHPCPVLIM